jgi:recombinational DNA repair protein (RecF pathway)
MEIEVEGIVLDAYARARSSQLVELISSEGLITVLVSPSLAKTSLWNIQDLTQPLHQVQYSLIKKNEWYHLKEGQTLERFDYLRSDLVRLQAAQQMRWAIKKMARQGLECLKLYTAFCYHLKLFNQDIPPSMVLASFLAKTLYVEGHLDPFQSFQCPKCSLESLSVPTGEQDLILYFNEEGLVCSKHGGNSSVNFSRILYQLYCILALNRSVERLKEMPEIGLDETLIQVIKQLNS